MKKALISIIGVILLILICVFAFRGISIGKLSIYSVKNLKEQSLKLDKKIEEANTEINQNYAKSIADIETATTNLKNLKEEYETKVGLNGGLGITQIEKYKIEYLWSIIGGYGTAEGVIVDLDIKETSIDDTHNINFTLYGSYTGITDFLYDIENDDELNYRIKDFKIEPSSTTTTTTTDNKVTTVNTGILKATFVVENVIIKFD
ncbi:MAG: hypothetical protein ACI4U9_03645 [Clostridia bacterium]